VGQRAQVHYTVRRQSSGNAHGIIKGIGVVTCVVVNPHTAQYWVMDDRIHDPDGDGQSKLDHMLANAVHDQWLPFRTVLMEPWYATKNLMLFIESKCPLKGNRYVDDSAGQSPDQRVDSLTWTQEQTQCGK